MRRKGAPKTKITKTRKRVEPRIDMLKNLRICRYWAKSKYGLSIYDLEMMLFLYTEELFTRNQFEEYKNIMPWQRQYFYKLKNAGLISQWRKRHGNEAGLWELSFKGRGIIREFYKRLIGEVLISEKPHSNKCFDKRKQSYTDKVFAHATKKANKDTIERRQRPSQE